MSILSPYLRRSFLCLNIAQFLGAFTDNALKVVTCLLALDWVRDPALGARWIALAGAAFVIPYLLFSMLAGSMADRYSKSRLFVLMQWVEVPLMLLAAVGLAMQSLGGLVCVLFLTGTQSALFSPAKYGLLPEIFSPERLAWANGVAEAVIFAGILLGTLAGSFAVDYLHGHLSHIGTLLAAIATVGAIASMGLQKTPAADPAKRLRLNPIADVGSEWRLLLKSRLLWFTTVAIGYFWMLGGLVQLNTLEYAKVMMNAGPKATGILLTALAVGTGAGSYAGGKAAGKTINLLPVRMGIVGVATLLVLLLFVYHSFALALTCLFLLGFCGGCYIVPLNAVIQARSPADERGRVIAITNFFSFSGILLASGVLWLLGSAVGWTPAAIFFTAGAMTITVAFLIWFLLPARGVSL